jgi:Zn-dependent protease
MRSSYQLGRFFGIDVRVHVTFFILPALLAWQAYSQTGRAMAALSSALMVAIVFLFVVMHEYGHALTARRFGVRTRGITLYPIGGVALLESMPKKPSQQILVAIAGPAVNFILAAGIAVAMLVFGYSVLGSDLDPSHGLGGVLDWMLGVNLMLGLFNLIPALPMDGGRVLNAALALRMPPVRATRIASRVAKVFAIGLFAFAALSEDGTFWHGLIALFVWTASNAEQRAAEHRARDEGEGTPVTQVMGRTPWGRATTRVPSTVVEVVEGPNGPEARILRTR